MYYLNWGLSEVEMSVKMTTSCVLHRVWYLESLHSNPLHNSRTAPWLWASLCFRRLEGGPQGWFQTGGFFWLPSWEKKQPKKKPIQVHSLTFKGGGKQPKIDTPPDVFSSLLRPWSLWWDELKTTILCEPLKEAYSIYCHRQTPLN